jgi:DNA mismatch endonuclease (patch repair protein)
MPYLFGKSNGMFGKHHSIKTKEKIAKTKIGKQRAIKIKRKISNGVKTWFSISKNKKKFLNDIKSRNHSFAQTPLFRKKQSINALKRWKDPIYKKKMINSFNIPSKDTTIEKILQKELKAKNIKFKKHIPIVCCIPDIFIEPNICIFADGDHWHGNPIKYKSTDHIIGIKFAKDVWKKDKMQTHNLELLGYKVLRFWESDIKKDIKSIIVQIQTHIA